MKKFNRSIILMTILLSLALVSCKTKAPEMSHADSSVGVSEVTLDTSSQANQVNIIYFNDFHGNVAEDVSEWGKNIGMAKMIGYANNAKETLPNTFVISGGDNYQGTAISNLTYGAPVSAMIKSLGVPYCAVGNHEFDWGVKHLVTWQEDGGFTFLAANIVDKATGEPIPSVKPYGFVNIGKYKIAFVGLAHPDTATLVDAKNVANITFTDPVAAAQKWVTYLKSGKAPEGTPDAIIALTHIDSYQDYDTMAITGNAVKLTTVDGLDAILSAHSHATVSGEVNGMPIIQAYKYGRSLGKMTLNFNDDGSLANIETEVDPVYKIKSNIIPDAKGTADLAMYEEQTNSITKELLGTAAADFTHDRSSNNVSKLGYWFSKLLVDRFGTQVAIFNGGSLRRTLYAGDITMGDAYEIMPFDGYPITLKLPGKDLKAAIDHGIENAEITDGEFYGVKVVYDPAKEFEHRIVSITLNDGTPIVDDQLYTVTISDFMFTGGDKYDFSNATDVVETYVDIRSIIVDEIKAKGTIVPMEVDNITTVK
jgi:2',3'-cyclic-nucleotide 2'-phosphodiesterase/3'-nucleotidase